MADIRCCAFRQPVLLAAVLVAGTLLATRGTYSAEPTAYERDVRPLLQRKCFGCHGPVRQEAGLRLDTVELMLQGGDSGPALVRGDADGSLLIQRVSADESERMPPEGLPLSRSELERLMRWIQRGADGPAGERPLPAPGEHWAFQPFPRASKGPRPHVSGSIDSFIRDRLQQAGLSWAPPADATTLIRRLYLDLWGLPPTPEQTAQWQRQLAPRAQRDARGALVVEREAAVERLVDHLLASPRYGERWAQHWLDVVRYADTHGFEVNTPRPHAWPYRDYVIEAFNQDKPYDQFVIEQLAGDQCGEDRATGFLVAAAVLLPGQIGKDEASMRQARQDALDEVIVGTGASFLGLSIGCARCHNHKFDPLLQEDYYAFQAFFAGLSYGDRAIHDAEFQERQQRAAELEPRLHDLRTKLARYALPAFPGRTLILDDEDSRHVTSLKTKNGHGTNPEGTGRGYRDDQGSAERLPNLSQGRYTWWDNVPGEDTFTWNPSVSGTFHVWVSWGVHGSGVHTRDARYVLDRDGDLATRGDQQELGRADQYYFAGQESGESEQKPLWSGCHYLGVHELQTQSRVVLRGGETGTGITADVLVLQEAVPEFLPSGSSPLLPRLRPPVNARHNSVEFAPVEARLVRFRVLATIDDDRHEPCLDELEVYAVGSPENLALATAGSRATSSGNYSDTGKHQLSHINDGRYGNRHSWISDRRGGGWVQVELPGARRVNRVEWGRDREGQFQDRLPVRYRIEVSADGSDWTEVAGSDDRLPPNTPFDSTLALLRHSPENQAAEVRAWAAELQQLEEQRRRWLEPQLVYGGVFSSPEPTWVLHRGDPEQPGSPIAPAVPQILGDLRLDEKEPEAERRLALARWIASPDNPLTARVLVNRIWQYHFGTGLVDTPSDFGLNGSQPSHPELLDWLAAELVRGGWSIKQLHRLILLSRTYRQSSQIVPAGLERDADGRLLWRFPPRRLEAEAIRDSLLHVAGSLNLEMGGPGFDFFASRGGLSGFPPVEQFGPDQLRRMVYSHKIRMEPVPVFGAFDCPDAGQPTPRRSQSTTPLQALNLFNSPFVLEQAGRFAARVEREAEDSTAARVHHAFQLALSRAPTTAEARSAEATVDRYGLVTLCRVLVNSNEFLFLP